MSRNTDSDETYCPHAEKEEKTPIRRSKRLSQRCLFTSFRSNKDLPVQRLLEIYHNLKSGELCSNWSISDWQAQKFEVESIQNQLEGKQIPRISFIFKEINKNLRKLSFEQSKRGSPTFNKPNQNNDDKDVHSPNILAGMMTEAFTEIPPYQPENLAVSKNTDTNTKQLTNLQLQNTSKQTEQSSLAITQKNPLDLTKRDTRESGASEPTLTQAEFSAALTQHRAKISTPITPDTNYQENSLSNKGLFIRTESMIDLTTDDIEIVKPKSRRGKNARKKTADLLCEWFDSLPSQELQKMIARQKKCPKDSIAQKRKPNSIKKLFTEPESNTNKNLQILNCSTRTTTRPIYKQDYRPCNPRSKQSLRTEGFVSRNHTVEPPCEVQSEHFYKQDSRPSNSRSKQFRRTEGFVSRNQTVEPPCEVQSEHFYKQDSRPSNSRSKQFRRTEGFVSRNHTVEPPSKVQSEHAYKQDSSPSNSRSKQFLRTEGFINRNHTVEPPPKVQSEHVSDLSPNCILDELLDLDDNESLVSFRHNFKEVFGTDNLSDVFGCDEEVYNLKENHVRKLAQALNVDYDKLKDTIKSILSTANGQNNVEENIEGQILLSDTSVVECSQSPPQQRRLLSQRSQISK